MDMEILVADIKEDYGKVIFRNFKQIKLQAVSCITNHLNTTCEVLQLNRMSNYLCKIPHQRLFLSKNEGIRRNVANF